MFDRELESFKTSIDLRAYAAGQGYVIDRRDSWRGSAVMRHENGDKIIISRQSDGHYTYWSPRDDGDNGTIIDFIKNRKRISLGAIRKDLRAWTGVPANVLPDLPELLKTEKDREAVQRCFAAMSVAHRHPYLEHARGIPALTFQDWRFKGRIMIDGHGNAVFPHFDAQGLCGYELKNRGFTGYAPGGSKGLWLSKAIAEDNRFVVCESSIDALSFYVLFPDGRTRFASTGGKMSQAQHDLIRAQIERMPEGSEIMAAMDNDAAGRGMANVIGEGVKLTGRSDLRFVKQEPQGCKDWNEILQRRVRAYARGKLSVARPA